MPEDSKKREFVPEEWTDASIDRWRGLCITLGVVGSSLATVGVVVGIAMATKETAVECGPGESPSGNSSNCYAYNHAGQGTAIALICAVLITLVILAAVIACALPAVRRAEP